MSKASEGVPWDPDAPLERVPYETSKANNALRDYALMGPGRSLSKLAKEYNGQKEKGIEPPTVHLTTIENWSSSWEWQARVAAWEAIQFREAEREFQEERNAWRKRRRAVAQGMLMLVSHAIAGFDPEEASASLSEVVRAFQAAMDELRVEYGDDGESGVVLEETRRLKVNWREDARRLGIDPSIALDQAAQYLASEIAGSLPTGSMGEGQGESDG